MHAYNFRDDDAKEKKNNNSLPASCSVSVEQTVYMEQRIYKLLTCHYKKCHQTGAALGLTDQELRLIGLIISW